MTRSAHTDRTVYAALAVAVLAVTAFAVPTLVHASRDRGTPAPGTPSMPPVASYGPTPTAAVAPPALPYLHHGLLYADGRQVPAAGADYVEARGDTTLVGDWTPPGHIAWSVLHGDRLVRLPYLDDQPSPALSTDGSQAAVVTNPTTRSTRVATYDLSSGRMTAHLDLDLPQTCCDGGSVQGVSIAADGRVYWLQDTGIHVWSPGSASAPRVQVDDPIDEVGPVGPIVAVGNGPAGTMGTVDDAGRFTPGRRLPVNQGAMFSPDGREIAYDVADQLAAKLGTSAIGPTLMDADSGRTVALQPSGDFKFWVGFEDDGDVLVITTSAGNHLERCNTADGSCETVMDLPGPLNSWTFS